MTTTVEKAVLGWREWVALPQLGLSHLKCKVDTGARSSALHAFAVEEFFKEDRRWVKFGLHPLQHNDVKEIWCEAPVTDIRRVTDSGGHTTERYFITTPMVLGGQCFPITLSLTSRDNMLFRMLLGREAMKGRFLVDPGVSYQQGRESEPLS